MPLLFAYLLLILLWSSTPLAVKWSSEFFAAPLAVALRLSLAALIAVPFVLVIYREVLFKKNSWKYFSWAALSLFPAMPLLYSAAVWLPSGWIALLYAVSPFFTALVEWLWKGRGLSPKKIFALLLAFFGLLLIFWPALQFGDVPVWAPLAVLLSALLVSFSGVALTHSPVRFPPLVLSTGALLLAVPAVWLCVLISGFYWPHTISGRAWGATIYLAIGGSLVALMLYFYLLEKLSAGSVSLITMITPVIALLLGYWLEDEPLTWYVMGGAVLMLAGLLLLTSWNFGRWFEFYIKQGAIDNNAENEIRATIDRYK